MNFLILAAAGVAPHVSVPVEPTPPTIKVNPPITIPATKPTPPAATVPTPVVPTIVDPKKDEKPCC